MTILIILIVVVVVVFFIIAQNVSTQPTTVTGNLKNSYSNFVLALTSVYGNEVTLICDNNEKLIFRVFQTTYGSITGEFLFSLQITTQGHFVRTTLRSGKTYSSEKKYFAKEQSVEAYKETIAYQGFPLTSKMMGEFLHKTLR